MYKIKQISKHFLESEIIGYNQFKEDIAEEIKKLNEKELISLAMALVEAKE